MERPTTFLDVLASPTGKWIIIFIGIVSVCVLFIIFAPKVLSRVATKVIPEKDKKDTTKSQQGLQPT